MKTFSFPPYGSNEWDSLGVTDWTPVFLYLTSVHVAQLSAQLTDLIMLVWRSVYTQYVVEGFICVLSVYFNYDIFNPLITEGGIVKDAIRSSNDSNGQKGQNLNKICSNVINIHVILLEMLNNLSPSFLSISE